MAATLFGVPASHPTLAAELMLRRKRIGFRRIDLTPGLHRGLLRGLGYSGVTVPAMRMDGARLQGTKAIALALDAIAPESPLLPGDPERRAAVEAAESWGDEVLQPVARRLVWASLKRNHSTIATYLEGSHTGLPTVVASRAALPTIPIAVHINKATDENARRDLAALSGMIEHVDELIAAGTLGGTERNVADYQIATSVSLLLTMEDLRPYIEGRPADRHARAVVERQPGRLPPALPADWLPPRG